MAKKQLGGVMIWEISYDTLKGDLSLLRAMDQTLQIGDCDVKTFYKDEDGDGLPDIIDLDDDNDGTPDVDDDDDDGDGTPDT